MLGFLKREYHCMVALDADVAAVAELHGKSFPRGWSETEVEALAAHPQTHLIVVRPVGGGSKPPLGFVIYRIAADEAEILSVAVDPSARRNGLGKILMRETIRRLQGERIASLVLEVDSTNVDAVELYNHLGFDAVGLRPGYYARENTAENTVRSTAIIMRLSLA